MTFQPPATDFAVAALPHAARRANTAPYAFDLHPALFATTIACYFLFLGIMAATFMNPELILPFVIFATYIVMAFGVPGLWARLLPADPRPRPTLRQWMRAGIDTGSGHLTGGAAAAQVLTLPLLIVLWGVLIAVICALS
ncbi:MAG: hypothetical protein JWM65_2953 [Sphingomonas bacterium]|nr:hypothetical protein [Sphingomonas bacterium]